MAYRSAAKQNNRKRTVKKLNSKTSSRKGLLNVGRKKFSLKLALPVVALTALVGFFVVRAIFAAPAGLINPLNFVGSSWQFPNPGNRRYTSQSVITQFTKSSGTDGYFAAMQVSIGGTPAYIGLQTNGNNPTGKIAVFSVWNAQRAKSKQYAAPFSGEGSGYSTRISYPWAVGQQYRLKVAKLAADPKGDWWAGYVNGTEIGRIQVQPRSGNLGTTAFTFLERYSGPIDSCDSIQPTTVAFRNIRTNGSIGPTKRTPSTSTACSRYRSIANVSGGYVAKIGRVAGTTIGSTRPNTQPQTDIDIRTMNYTFLVGGTNSYCPAANVFNKGSGKKACKLKKPGDYFSTLKVPTNAKATKQFCWLIAPTISKPTSVRLVVKTQKQSIGKNFRLTKGAHNYCLSIRKEVSTNTFDNYGRATLIGGQALVYGAGYK